MVAGCEPLWCVMDVAILPKDLRGQLFGVEHVVNPCVFVGGDPVVCPGKTEAITQPKVKKVVRAAFFALEVGDDICVLGVVEVTIDQKIGLGFGCNNRFDVFAQESGFIAAHFRLVAFIHWPFRFQMGAEQTDTVTGGGLDGGIMDPPIVGESLACHLIAQIRLVVGGNNREAAEQTEVACGIRPVAEVRVGQIKSGLFKASLQVQQVFFGADFANPEDVRFHIRDHAEQGLDFPLWLRVFLATPLHGEVVL